MISTSVCGEGSVTYTSLGLRGPAKSWLTTGIVGTLKQNLREGKNESGMKILDSRAVPEKRYLIWQTSQVWLNSSLELRRLARTIPGAQISITSVLMRRRQREITKRRGEDDITMEAEFGVMQPRAKEFKLPPHRYRLYPRYRLYLLIKEFKL